MFLLIYLLISVLPFITTSFYSNGNNIHSKTNVQKIKLLMTNDNVFLKLLDYNLNLTKKLELKSMRIDERFEKGNMTNDAGMIYNYCYSNKDFRKVRFTYLDGKSKIQYFGLVLHPIYDYDIPIFNFEVILYNNDKTVYTLNMIKMDNSNDYNEKYVKPFITTKKKYPQLKENLAVKLSGYNVFGNYISESILLGKFIHKHKDIDSINEIYNDIIIPSFTEYMEIYLDLIKSTNRVITSKELENIKSRHKLFDMKKAFVESRYDIRNCFDDEWYRAMLYDFFYELEPDTEFK
jgi:hypothetical protein